MKKRTANPFYTKRQQRHEAAIKKVAAAAAARKDTAVIAECAKGLRESREKQINRSQRVRTLAPWQPMPRAGWRVENGVEIRR